MNQITNSTFTWEVLPFGEVLCNFPFSDFFLVFEMEIFLIREFIPKCSFSKVLNRSLFLFRNSSRCGFCNCKTIGFTQSNLTCVCEKNSDVQFNGIILCKTLCNTLSKLYIYIMKINNIAYFYDKISPSGTILIIILTSWKTTI